MDLSRTLEGKLNSLKERLHATDRNVKDKEGDLNQVKGRLAGAMDARKSLEANEAEAIKLTAELAEAEGQNKLAEEQAAEVQ